MQCVLTGINDYCDILKMAITVTPPNKRHVGDQQYKFIYFGPYREAVLFSEIEILYIGKQSFWVLQ